MRLIVPNIKHDNFDFHTLICGRFDDGGYWIEEKPGAWTDHLSAICARACFLDGAPRDDWRAVLLESGRGWMIRLVLVEGYRLRKMDE